jgi:transposase
MEKNKDKTKKFIADHFKSEGVSKSTIYSLLKRKESGSDYIRRVGSGRPAKIFNESGLLKLKRLVDHKDGIYQKKNWQQSSNVQGNTLERFLRRNFKYI